MRRALLAAWFWAAGEWLKRRWRLKAGEGTTSKIKKDHSRLLKGQGQFPARNPASSRHKRKGRQINLPPLRRLERKTYFRLVIAVRSAESLAMPVAPHQPEPKPPGLIAVTKDGLMFRVA